MKKEERRLIIISVIVSSYIGYVGGALFQSKLGWYPNVWFDEGIKTILTFILLIFFAVVGIHFVEGLVAIYSKFGTNILRWLKKKI